MRRRTRAVVLVGIVAGWGLSALLEETGVLGWTVAAETFYQKDGIELSGSVRVVARGVGTCEVREGSHSEGVLRADQEQSWTAVGCLAAGLLGLQWIGEAAFVSERAFPDRVGMAAMHELDRPGRNLCQAGAVERELSGAAEAVWNGSGRGGERYGVHAGVPRTPTEIRELGRELPVRESNGRSGNTGGDRCASSYGGEGKDHSRRR